MPATPARLLLAAAILAVLSAPTFAALDVQAGEALHAKQCTSCHVQRWGGDGSGAYTRPDHRIRDMTALRQRVAACSAQTGAKFFPEDEENVAAFLAQRYYKFK